MLSIPTTSIHQGAKLAAALLMAVALVIAVVPAAASAKRMTPGKAERAITGQANVSTGVLNDRDDPPFPDAVGAVHSRTLSCRPPRGRKASCSVRWLVTFTKLSTGADLGTSVCALKASVFYRSLAPSARHIKLKIKSFTCDPGPTEVAAPPPAAPDVPNPTAPSEQPPPAAPPTGPHAPGPPGSGAHAAQSPTFYGCSDWGQGQWQGWPYLWTYSCFWYYGGNILEEDVYFWDPSSQQVYFWFYWFPGAF